LSNGLIVGKIWTTHSKLKILDKNFG